MKLHEITSEMREIAEMDDMPEDAIRDTLESVQGQFDDKAKTIATVSVNMNSDIQAIELEIDRLNKRKQFILNRDKSLREYLKTNMIATGIKKIACPLLTITLAKGRDILSIDSEGMIPDEYMRVKTEVQPDKKRLLADLKQGKDIPGVSIRQSEPSVRIK